MRVLLFGISWSVLSCALAVSFDDYGGGGSGRPPNASSPRFGVRGTAVGLDGKRATLFLEGVPLDVTDGPFTFPATLADGVEFDVTARAPETHACAVEGGAGRIAGADASGVVVRCVSKAATLKALSVSLGPLSPPFAAGTFSYTVKAKARTKGILAGATWVPTTLTVNATPAQPGARVSIGDVGLESGTPSAPFVVKTGANVFEIAVVAPGAPATSGTRYTVFVEGEDFDYLKASNTTERMAFGAGVAFSADTLAVAGRGNGYGNVDEPPGFNGEMGVYVFTRHDSTWSQQALIIQGLSAAPPRLALDGDTLAICSGEGLAVYTRTGAVWSAQLFPPMPPSALVALSADTLAVADYNTGTGAQTVNIFTRSAGVWALETVFFLEGATGVSALGLSGDTLVVGGAYDSSFITHGAAYFLGRSGTTWSLQAYVQASNPRTHFGAAVAVSGDTVVVGSPGEGTGIDPGAGAAYVFVRTGASWSQQGYLEGASLPGNGFGTSVAVLGNTVAVGAPNEGLGSGAAYVFQRAAGSWTLGSRISPPGGRRVAYGSSVALGSDALAVGAPNEESKATGINGDRADQSLVNAGAVFVH